MFATKKKRAFIIFTNSKSRPITYIYHFVFPFIRFSSFVVLQPYHRIVLKRIAYQSKIYSSLSLISVIPFAHTRHISISHTSYTQREHFFFFVNSFNDDDIKIGKHFTALFWILWRQKNEKETKKKKSHRMSNKTISKSISFFNTHPSIKFCQT